MSIPAVPTNLPGIAARPVATPPPTAASPSFGDAIAGSIDQVSQLEFAADAAIQDVAAGGDTTIHELMTATSKAQLGVELMATVRDRAVEAYTEIMRMQV